MKEMLIQLCIAPIGAMGFAMVFRLRKQFLPWAFLGGFISWGIYLLVMSKTESKVIACFFAAGFIELYSEILARAKRAPATIFLMPSVIPLIPGSALYYTMSYAVQRKWEIAGEYGSLTVQYALGIAGGISLAWACWYMLAHILEYMGKRAL